MSFDAHRLIVELQHLEWARHLGVEVIGDIAATAKLVELQAGQVLVELDSEINSIYFVVSGQLEGTLFDGIGKKLNEGIFRRGSVVGLFSVLLPHRSHLYVEAVEQTIVIQLTLDQLLQLTSKYPAFQLTMFRVGANIAKQLVMLDRDRPKPATIGIAHHSPVSRPLVAQLAQRLQQLGELPCVATDDESWKPVEGIPHSALFEQGIAIGPQRIERLLQEWTARNRLFIDFQVNHSVDDLNRMVSYSDFVLWCIQPQDVAAALQALKAMHRFAPRLREKVGIVWILNYDAPVPPYVPELYEFAARDFKTHSGQLQPNQGKLLQQGVERIVHYLRGVQIGLALGGGAARGMAHLGVLEALEQHGIYVDMLAGTSAGAMVGAYYALGMDPKHMTECFKNDLRPNWFFRHLRGGGYWYLLDKYRRNRFEPMLRKYMHNFCMEQLSIPMAIISVDLVEGVPLVRDTGDATLNMLESINLPPLSVPIVQFERAIVDGGLLNNVPANTLVAKRCNFVIASTVTANLEKDFMGIRSKKSRGMSRFTTTIQVIMRQSIIQSYNMNAVGVEPADFVIAPDVTSFDLSEFTRADEMAEIGEKTTNTLVHQLKTMLSKLDANLFA